LQEPGDYADRFREAEQEAADVLEAEAVRRAVQGVDEAVYFQGEQVGTRRRYSDLLLIFLLKGMRPDKFRERQEVVHREPASDRATALQEVVENSGEYIEYRRQQALQSYLQQETREEKEPQ
jgi:hypothetical protein